MALLILAALATYRLATDFAWEDGPGNAYAWARGGVAARFGVQHWLTEGVNCPICLSFWLSIPASAAVAPLDYTAILYWLGIAGAAAFLARWAAV